MSQFVVTPTKTFQASAAIAQHLRVKLNSSNKLAVCGAGATENELGTMERPALAADETGCTVRLTNAMGTCKMVALTAFAQEALVYAAAGGYVDDVVNGKPIGIALDAATAVGDVVEVLRVHAAVIVSHTDAVDDAALSFGTGTDAQILFSTGDASNHTFVVAVDDTSQQLHITDKGAKATDWNLAAATHPTLYIHSNTTPATDYVSLGGHDGTTVTLNVGGGTTFNIDIAGTTEVIFTATATTLPGQVSAVESVANTAGVGITGTADNYVTSVEKTGTIIKTTILIEVDGLNSGGTADDVVGADGAGVAHLGQITAAVNGTIFAGKITCLEAPTGGDPDIDLWYTDDATGVEDTLVTAMANQVQCIDHGDWAAGEMDVLTAFPAATKYLYLATGAATDATYTAGILLIELYGVAP